MRQFVVELFTGKKEGWVSMTLPFSSREDAERVMRLYEQINPQLEHRIYEVTNDPARCKAS